MITLKQKAIAWAEKVLVEQPKLSHEETTQQLQELIILGSLFYDNKGNWLPQLKLVDSFEVRPVKVIK